MGYLPVQANERKPPMKPLNLSVVLSALLAGTIAHADQAATLTCTGPSMILTEKSPYLGENSKFTQNLFVLKSKESNRNESADTAYFLTISQDVGPGGTIYIGGKNGVGGKFLLTTTYPKETGDGTTIHEESVGTLTFSHGPLKGKEKVTCVRE
jgi:hypothetical protein